MHQPESFIIHYNNNPPIVIILSIAGQTVYRVLFSDGLPQPILTRATHQNANRFWTSVPE
jgi:hypothetical protein